MKLLNVPNPQAHDMGEMFGIPIERRDAISKGMDAMVRQMNEGETRLVLASDVVRYIESLCETTEELLWACINHTAWMFRTGRMATTPQGLEEMIKKYGQPKTETIKKQ